MKKINLPLICDTIFTAVSAFAVFFTAMRHYTKSAYIALPFAVAAALLCGALAFLVISGKQKKRRLVTTNAKERELFKTHLCLLSKTECARLVAPALGEGVSVEKYRICADERVYYPMFTFKKLDEGDVAAVIKRRADRAKSVLCNACTPEAEALAERFNIGVIVADDIFDALKKSGGLPEKYLCGETVKRGTLQKIRGRFNKKLAAPLFLSGLALLFMSFFTLFPVYYIASGSALLVAAVAALFIS